MSLAEIVTAAVATAALFVCFVLLRPARGCSGDCGACTGTCPTEGGKS
jgi:hypothetical protein